MRTFALRSLVFCSVAVACAAAATEPARADAHADLLAAIDKTFAHDSYHMHMKTASQTIDGDVAADGRERVTVGPMQMVVTKDAMYVKRGATWQKLSTGGSSTSPTDAFRRALGHRTDFSATDLGMRAKDGALLHAYRATNHKSNGTETVYLDGQGRIVRVDLAGGDFMQFSQFGEPLNITAPV